MRRSDALLVALGRTDRRPRAFKGGVASQGVLDMRMVFVAVTAISLMGSVASAQAGCVTGAIVGGIAGHFLHHGAVGAAAGCAYGHHRTVVKRRTTVY